jgi:uncharacterized protein YuzE
VAGDAVAGPVPDADIGYLGVAESGVEFTDVVELQDDTDG